MITCKRKEGNMITCNICGKPISETYTIIPGVHSLTGQRLNICESCMKNSTAVRRLLNLTSDPTKYTKHQICKILARLLTTNNAYDKVDEITASIFLAANNITATNFKLNSGLHPKNKNKTEMEKIIEEVENMKFQEMSENYTTYDKDEDTFDMWTFNSAIKPGETLVVENSKTHVTRGLLITSVQPTTIKAIGIDMSASELHHLRVGETLDPDQYCAQVIITLDALAGSESIKNHMNMSVITLKGVLTQHLLLHDNKPATFRHFAEEMITKEKVSTTDTKDTSEKPSVKGYHPEDIYEAICTDTGNFLKALFSN